MGNESREQLRRILEAARRSDITRASVLGLTTEKEDRLHLTALGGVRKHTRRTSAGYVLVYYSNFIAEESCKLIALFSCEKF